MVNDLRIVLNVDYSHLCSGDYQYLDQFFEVRSLDSKLGFLPMVEVVEPPLRTRNFSNAILAFMSSLRRNQPCESMT